MKLHKYQTFFQFLTLVVLYVGGMQFFIYLKLLGISELQATTEAERRSMLLTSTIMGLMIAFSVGLLELKLFPKWSHFSFRKYLLYKYTAIILTIVGGGIVIYLLFIVAWMGLSVGA